MIWATLAALALGVSLAAQGQLLGRIGRPNHAPAVEEDLEVLQYIGVGAASTNVGNNSLFPTLPTGYVSGDLLICAVWQRNAIVGVDDDIVAITSGWTEFAGDHHDTNQAGGQMKLYRRLAASANETAPEFDLTGAEGADTTVSFCFGFRNADTSTPIDLVGTFTSATASTNIGPITGLTPVTSGAAVVVVGGKGSQWTSVATLTTDALGWAEIAEPDTATGDDGGLVANYFICPAACGAISNATFSVTGATSVASSGIMFAIRPAEVDGTPPVVPEPLRFTSNILPDAQEDIAYTPVDVCLAGGTTPYASIALATGEILPTGLSFAYTAGNTCGTLSGTPAQGTDGPYTISFTGTDGLNPVPFVANGDYTLTVIDTLVFAPPVITTTTLDGGQSGVAYSEVISSQDGDAPLTWTLTAGSLPTGLTNPFPATGATVTLSGTPSASGTFAFTVQICDEQVRCDTQALSIAIATPIPTPSGTPLTDAIHPRLLITSDAYSTSGATRAEICTRVAGLRNAQWQQWIDQLEVLWTSVSGNTTSTYRARMKGYAFLYALAGPTATTNPCNAKLLPNSRTSTDWGDKAAELIEGMLPLACDSGWARDGYGTYNSSAPFVYDWVHARLVARGTDDDVLAKLITCMGWQGAKTMYDDGGGTANGRHTYKALAIKNDGVCATTSQVTCDAMYGNIFAGYGEFYGTQFDAASPDGGWTRGYEYMIHSGNPYLFYPIFLESYRTSHLLPKNTFYGNADQYTLVKNLPYQWLHAIHPKSFLADGATRWYLQATNNITSPKNTNSEVLMADLSFARIVKEGDPTSANLSEWLLRNRVTGGTAWSFTNLHDLTYAPEGLWLVDDGAITGPAAAGIPTSRFFDGSIGMLSAFTAWEDQTATSWQLHGPRYHSGTYLDTAAGSFSISRNGPLIVRDGVNAHEAWGNKHGFSALFLGDTDFPQMTLVDASPTTKVMPNATTATRLDFFAADGVTPTNHSFVAGDITATQTVWLLWRVEGASNAMFTQHGDFSAGRAYWCRLTTIVDADTIGCTYDQNAYSDPTVRNSQGVIVTTTAQPWRHYTGYVPPFAGQDPNWDRGATKSPKDYGLTICCGHQLTTAQSAYLRGMTRHRLSEGSYDFDYGFVDYTKFYNGALGTDGTNPSKLSSGTRQMVGFGRNASGIDQWIIYDRITTTNTKYEKLIKFTPAGAATGVSYAVDGTPTAVRTGRTDYNDGTQFAVTNAASGSNGKLIGKWVATGATAAINIRKTGGQGACSWSLTTGLGACDHSREDAWGRQIDNGSENSRDRQFGVGHSIWFVPDTGALYNTFAFCLVAGTATVGGAATPTSVDCENLGGTNWESIRNGLQVAAFARTETTHTSGTIPYPSTTGTYETTIFDVTGTRTFTAGANISAVTQVDTGRNCLTQTCVAGDASDIRINVSVTAGGTAAARTLTVN